ncbi:hypothetical protein F2P47_14625 [Parvibaculum sedimenti]|uniref:DoxX family protein n=1 Tax=Parvibaculum sedimenti TaxID=2608632 RepID=A0A6N6VJD3_9HYPH|nr:hypothetical protein [Parvibaculum sedimenti]KAB7739029.1 hypothetical protein F2P47_14625 [Parvibaculum sedimenti]
MRPPSRAVIAVLSLLGAVNLARGSIHLFAPDGGLTAIAGLDLGQAREIALFFIGAVGVGQITLGAVDLLVATRFRMMALPLLLVHMGELALGLFLFLLWRPLPHAVPGQYGAVFSFIAVGIITAWELLRGRADATS